MIRVGIQGNPAAIMRRVRALNAPVLVSANSLWNERAGRFDDTWKAYAGLDVALDSGGFMAMKRYGGFRFPISRYAELAREMKPTWWAAMDLCCEPEITADLSECARSRVLSSAALLDELHVCVMGEDMAQPMPVLQGWLPDDYVWAFDWYDAEAYSYGFKWPRLIGVGSVCQRQLLGPDGLINVLNRLDAILPADTRLHLFGVKGEALNHLAGHPRFASMDSCAWNYDARRLRGRPAERKARRLYAERVPGYRFDDGEFKARRMERWFRRQHFRLAQPPLL